MKRQDKNNVQSNAGIGSKVLATALTAALAMSSVPSVALAFDNDDLKADNATESQLLGYADDVAQDKEGSESSDINATTVSPEKEQSFVVDGDVASDSDGKGTDDETIKDKADADKASTDALDVEDDVMGSLDGEEEAGIAMTAELGDLDEAEAKSEWVRPDAGTSISLAGKNNKFVSETSNSTYYTYPVMQACTSTLLGRPSITAYGTRPSNGLDFADEQGVAVSDIVQSNIDTSSTDRYVFWKVKLLSSQVGSSQPLNNGTNKTSSGITVSRIRYNAGYDNGKGSWEYTSEGTKWTAFTVGSSSSQLVFYYKQISHLDENVSLTNDNDYRSPSDWVGNTGWGKNNKDAVCFLYQLYDENGQKIDIPATEAYYYSHTNKQEVVVSLSKELTNKYEIAKVSWDNYQEYIRGGQTYKQTCPGFEIPEKFSMLGNAETDNLFYINLPDTACNKSTVATEHNTCTNEHRGLYVIGIMVKGIESDQSISVKYWGGTPEKAALLGAQTVSVAGSDDYDWASSGYETAKEIKVTSALSYNGNNTVQTVPMTLPDEFEGIYEEDPYERVLEGNVLNLYFKGIPHAATITSEPVEKVYNGTPLLPSDLNVEVPEGFTVKVDEGALTGSQTTVGESVPVLDMSKVHIFKGEDGPEVTDIFDIDPKLGTMKVTEREILIIPEDDEKMFGDEDPKFAEPSVELISEPDGFTPIIEGDDLDISVYRADKSEAVNTDDEGNTIPYTGILNVAFASNPNYKVTVKTADFTIWPKDVDPGEDPEGPDQPSKDPEEPVKPNEDPEKPSVPSEDPQEPAQPVDPQDPQDPSEPEQPSDKGDRPDTEPNKVTVFDKDGNPLPPSNGLDGDGYKKVYDGGDIVPNAVAEKPGSTLLYSIDNGRTWSPEKPRFKDAGKYKVQIKATHPDCPDTDPIEVDMTINKRPVTIVADDSSKQYGDEDPSFTGTTPKLVNDDDLGVITFVRINDDEEVGTYPQVITALYTANPNYEVTVMPGTLDISDSVVAQNVADAGEQILDNENPLASPFDAQGHSCWVHWWILLGLVISCICTVVAMVRRIRCIRRVGKMEDDVFESGDLAANSQG